MKGLCLLFVASFAATEALFVQPLGRNCLRNPKCPAKDGSADATFVADETDCHKFYECSHGYGCLKECPTYNDGDDQLVFNPELSVCDWPENIADAVCGPQNETAKITSKIADLAPGKCPETGVVRIPHETDCNAYYNCENGHRSYAQHCGENLVFNPVIEACDVQGSVSCA